MPHLNGELQPSNVKATAVYDIASYATDLFLPLTDVGLTETALTFSGVTMTRDTSDSNQPLDSFPRVYSDTDSGLLLNEGNDTAFNQTYTLDPDMTAVIYKFSLNFCAVLTCSAYTNGGLNIGGLHIKISERSSNDRLLYENTFQSGAATLAATGTSMHWFTQDIVETIKVRKGNPIDIQLNLITVVTGTNTRQEGYAPVAPYLKTAVLKSFYETGISLHLHPDLSHADGVFKYKKERVSLLGQ
ncbi:MAG TPA: hypothetical protein EYN67_16650 [Flavobacteriales bacterium]|nr:hypothetical protein [Flavobacteriales bacterium]